MCLRHGCCLLVLTEYAQLVVGLERISHYRSLWFPTECTYTSHQYDPAFPFTTPQAQHNTVTQLYEFWDSPLATHLRNHVMSIARDLSTTLPNDWTHFYAIPQLLTHGVEDSNKGIIDSTLITTYLWTINTMFVDRMRAYQTNKLTDDFNFWLPQTYIKKFNYLLYKEIITLDKHVTAKGTSGRQAALIPVPRPNINNLNNTLTNAYKYTWCKHSRVAEIQQNKLVVNIIDTPTLMDLHLNPHITLDTG